MTDSDLGQMYLIYNDIMAIRSSVSILFFKIVKDQFTHIRTWEKYFQIDVRGLMFYMEGNIRFQVTCDDKIYFYKVDRKTLEIKLENVMNNYMRCNQMLFGRLVRYCITYKTS